MPRRPYLISNPTRNNPVWSDNPMKFLPTTKIPAYTRYGLLAHGVALTIGGLIMPRNSAEVLATGGALIVVAVVLSVLSALARVPAVVVTTEVLQGDIVGEQQPQLTDVQCTCTRTHALPQAA